MSEQMPYILASIHSPQASGESMGHGGRPIRQLDSITIVLKLDWSSQRIWKAHLGFTLGRIQYTLDMRILDIRIFAL